MKKEKQIVIPSPQLSLGLLKRVLERKNSSKVVEGSTLGTSNLSPFKAKTKIPFLVSASSAALLSAPFASVCSILLSAWAWLTHLGRRRLLSSTESEVKRKSTKKALFKYLNQGIAFFKGEKKKKKNLN